jgi:hypothetical protein
MFEHKHQPLLSRREFAVRLLRCFGLATAIVAFSLGLGSLGYHYLGDLPWIDALLNSAMILTGMGPVDRLTTSSGKLFATFYALYSGIAFLTMMAVLLAPVVHRLMHKLHADVEEGEDR